MSKNTGPNKENLEQTRRIFLKEAYKEFTNHGYADASTNRIVDATGMARGSLYYHFKDKKGLFTAVYTDMLKDLEKILVKEMEKQKNSYEAVKAGCSRYIELCMDAKTRRLILESYSALGYAERLLIQREGILGTFQTYIDQLMADGYFKGQDPTAVAILIYGMVSEAGRSFELTNDPERFRDMIIKTFQDFLDQLITQSL